MYHSLKSRRAMRQHLLHVQRAYAAMCTAIEQLQLASQYVPGESDAHWLQELASQQATLLDALRSQYVQREQRLGGT